ncbi:hypothetical protein EJB05_22849 [Eragrostis curvula]|uniref:Meg domain-containing protein n=1 Tax=Eragrostis curvula TaxID=38414 RepID=A0A5J9V6P0_9POAL|nr:hypothetical protein EJB05_22849 [Eragrostis curvula]
MEKYPKNMAAVVLLSLLILGCLANHAQCDSLAAVSGESKFRHGGGPELSWADAGGPENRKK